MHTVCVHWGDIMHLGESLLKRERSLEQGEVHITLSASCSHFLDGEINGV